MAAESAPVAGPRKRTLLAASCVGTSIEWYDYYIFGTAAALVFPQLFYPEFSDVAGTLAAFSTFAVGFVARPLGGAIIGHFGDRIGRKTMLVLTLLMAGIATFVIGLLPPFSAIGAAAPVLLVALRLIQGFGVGGEWGGAVLIATEHASPRERAAYGSFAQFGVPIGVLTSNLAFLLVSGLPDDAFLAWGWRIPFLLSIVMLGVGIYVRRKITDAPEFQRLKQQRTVSKVPFGELLRNSPATLGLASLVAIAPPAIGYTLIVYMLNYGTDVVGFNRTTLLLLIFVSTLPWIATIYISALIADRVGTRKVYAIGAAATVAAAFLLFVMVNTANVALALVAFVITAMVQGVMSGAQGGLFTQIFRTRMRYSGASIAYQIGGMLGGAVTPIVATALQGTYDASLPIASYVAGLAFLSFVAVLALRVTTPPDASATAGRGDAGAPVDGSATT